MTKKYCVKITQQNKICLFRTPRGATEMPDRRSDGIDGVYIIPTG